MIPDSVRRRYQSDELLLEQLAQRVWQDLSSYCHQRSLPFSARKKSLESVAEKLETGRFSAWSQLDDLYACSIIVPNLLEEPKVVDDLGKLVNVVKSRLRGSTDKSPDVFRFDSTRLYATIKPGPLDAPTEAIYNKLFEIQVRTAFEYAWSVATHPLVYKGGSVDWRRARLAAQLKATVEQMDSMILGFDGLAEHIRASPWPTLEAQTKIEIFFKSLADKGEIPSEVLPQDWTRFAANVFEVLRVTDRPRGTKPTDLLDEALERLAAAVQEQRAEKFPRSVSLFQFCLGTLLTDGFVGTKLHDYSALVTEEFVAMFGQVGNSIQRVDLTT